jgi:hypothetical protein
VRPPVRITLESTDEVSTFPPPARVWRGQSDDGTAIVAFITVAAAPTGDPRADARMRQALEERVTSSAVITIPVNR